MRGLLRLTSQRRTRELQQPLPTRVLYEGSGLRPRHFAKWKNDCALLTLCLELDLCRSCLSLRCVCFMLGSRVVLACCVLRRHLGSNMAGYSPATLGFLTRWSLQAITLFYLREDEVMLLESERPGAHLA